MSFHQEWYSDNEDFAFCVVSHRKGILMENKNIKSLANGIQVLLAIPHGRMVSVTELSRNLGITKGSISKILATFRSFGFVIQDEQTKKYSLGPALITLGYQALNQLDIRELAKPHMKHLTNRYNENSMLMVIQNEQAIVIEQSEASGPIKLTVKMGESHPLYCGAIPKLLLAFMPEEKIRSIVEKLEFKPLTENTIIEPEILYEKLIEIRKTGYSVSIEEMTEDAMAVAVPIKDVSGEVIAGLGISGPKHRMESHELESLVQDLLISAERISKELGAKA